MSGQLTPVEQVIPLPPVEKLVGRIILVKLGVEARVIVLELWPGLQHVAEHQLLPDQVQGGVKQSEDIIRKRREG